LWCKKQPTPGAFAGLTAQNAELKALPKTTQPTLVVLFVFGREELKRLFSQLYEAINAKPRSKFTLVIENNALRKVE